LLDSRRRALVREVGDAVGIWSAAGLDVDPVSARLGDAEPVNVLVIVRPTLRYDPRGEAGSDRYGDALGSGGSPKMIS
jgi:hypothetical protein